MPLSRIADFALERHFARWEFNVDHQLSASDVEPLTLAELLAMADDDARLRWERLTLGYTESAGLPALRDAITSLYEGVRADHVLVVAGAEEGIFLAMTSLLGAGDEIVVVTPAYQSLYSIAEAAGATVRRVPLRFERLWELDPAEVARAVTSRTRVIVANFPHNPTGAHVAPEVQRELLRIAESAGAVLFSDEVYRGLEHDAPMLPAAADLSERAVSLGVMSKTFALPGLRIGWLATQNASLLRECVRLKDYTTICSSAPSEILSLIALRSRARVIERSRGIVSGNIELARAFAARCSGDVEWIAPRAGSTAFPRFTARNADDVARELAERERVLLLPGTVFHAEPRHFRLGLGRRDLSTALSALERVLSRQPGAA